MSTLDALVVGAGPSGLAFAITAAKAGMKVGLADRPRRLAVGEVLPGSIQVPLHKLDARSVLDETGALRSPSTLSLWSTESCHERGSLFEPYGGAWFVDRQAFEAQLLRRARAAGVRLIAGGRQPVERHGIGWRLVDDAIKADLLVLANGRTACPIGCSTRSRDDRLVGLVTYDLVLAEDDRRFCLEAVDDGWWYSAPLPGGRSVFALMTDADLLPRGGQAALRAFWTDQLSRTKLTRGRLRGISAATLVLRPAGGSLRAQIAGLSWIAIGDAAAAYDPLCGQGVTAALSKGVAAAELIARKPDLGIAMTSYVAAERDAFSDYQVVRRELYGQAAAQMRGSEFWRRRH